MKLSRKVTQIHIHCTGSSKDTVLQIDRYHRSPKLNWREVGYHFIIQNGRVGKTYLKALDGSIEIGRGLESTPASVLGHNKGAIAIALVGSKEEEFTKKQFKSLIKLVKELRTSLKIPLRNVLGHNSFKDVSKECPCFNVEDKLISKLSTYTLSNGDKYDK